MPGTLIHGNGNREAGAGGPVAIIDIGSNSIRLVVYEGALRAPTPVFNEKVLCGLARGLTKSNRLADENIAMALASLARFRALAEAMGVGRFDVVATAAVRDAENGPEFVEEVRRRCGFVVRVLTGEEEARLSAMGVLSGIPEASGLMGDLGGGSMELVAIEDGGAGHHDTLPLGPLRLMDMANGDSDKAHALIDAHLARLPWLAEAAGKRFYPVGGAWRMLARIHMSKTDYPLHVIHQYTIRAKDAMEFARFVGRLSLGTLRKIEGVSRQRVETLPYAAYLFQRVIEATSVREVVFSAYGLREGCLYDRLSPEEQRIDPLLAICQREAERLGRTTADGEALFDWMTPIFSQESPRQRRLRLAACHLADIGWSEHPDYRGEMVFTRILRHPTVGTDHPGRLYMALAVASRHAALDKRFIRRVAGDLLSQEDMDSAKAIGLAMRLAYSFSGGVVALLRQAAIRREGKQLTLSLPDHADVLLGDVVARRFDALARLLSCVPEIEYYNLVGGGRRSGVSA